MVHSASVHCASRWSVAIWSRVYGTFLHHVFIVAASILLFVWLLSSGAHYLGHNLCRDFHRLDVLPAYVGELQVVVEVFLFKRHLRFVCLLVLDSILQFSFTD